MNPTIQRGIAALARALGAGMTQAAPNVNIIVSGEVSPRAVVREPIYLHVPPGHARHWARHCRAYDACGRPIYVVRSAEYEPGWRGEAHRRDDDHGRGHGHGRGHRD